MKTGVDLTAALGGLSWVPKSEKTRARRTQALLFSHSSGPTSPAEPGVEIDAGSVPLHPSFVAFMASCGSGMFSGIGLSAPRRRHEVAKTPTSGLTWPPYATCAGPAIATAPRVSFQKSELAQSVIGLAISVHRTLGPGLIESIYTRCLMHELKAANLRVDVEVTLPVRYKSLVLDHAYRADLIVEETLLVEIKSVECLLPIHTRKH